jgi:hypothetical protein
VSEGALSAVGVGDAAAPDTAGLPSGASAVAPLAAISALAAKLQLTRFRPLDPKSTPRNSRAASCQLPYGQLRARDVSIVSCRPQPATDHPRQELAGGEPRAAAARWGAPRALTPLRS